MKYAFLLTLVMCGCAAKNKQIAQSPGPHQYRDCHEVSINYKAEEVTVVCPLKKKAGK